MSVHSVVAQRSFSNVSEVISIKGEKAPNSRGQDPNINPDSNEICLSINKLTNSVEFDKNSCIRIENTTNNTIQIYMNSDFFTTVPPYGLLDALPVINTTTNSFYAVAVFENNQRLTWGPWAHVPNSCILMQLDEQ